MTLYTKQEYLVNIGTFLFSVLWSIFGLLEKYIFGPQELILCTSSLIIALFITRFSERLPNGGSLQEDQFEEKLPYNQGFVEKETFQENNGFGFGK